MTTTQLDEIRVMYVVAVGGPTGAKEAFDRIESKLPSLKGRRFYGTLLCREYRACVAIREGDDPEKLGLAVDVIPGGLYARDKVADWNKQVDRIGAMFDAMAERHPRDSARPSIEFYRSEQELILLLPILVDPQA